jgi:Lhr-like helicase
VKVRKYEPADVNHPARFGSPHKTCAASHGSIRDCLSGGRIGAIEESFISRLKTSDIFELRRTRTRIDAALSRDCAGSGLVFQRHSGRQKSARQLQASSGIFYEIFRNHDSGNRLLDQADDEVLLQEPDAQRIRSALEHMNASRVVVTRPKKRTLFAFPLNRRTLARKGEYGEARGSRRADAGGTR